MKMNIEKNSKQFQNLGVKQSKTIFFTPNLGKPLFDYSLLLTSTSLLRA